MDIDRTLEEVTDWIDETVKSNEDDGIQTDLFVETFEHACFIRWGSKKGDFPVMASGGLSDEIIIVSSGVLRDDGVAIVDPGVKKPFDLEQLVWKFLTETQMKDCEKGYEHTIKGPEGTFKITVEKL